MVLLLMSPAVTPAVMTLIVSRDCRSPMIPTTGPRIPPSPQLVTVSGGGGLGNTQR